MSGTGSGRTALHIWPNFGDPYSAWLYRLLRHCSRWAPHILCKEGGPERSREAFPWPAERITPVPEPAPWGRLSDGVRHWLTLRLLGRASSRVNGLIRSLAERHRFSLIHVHGKKLRYRDHLRGVDLPRVFTFYGTDVMREHSPAHMVRLRRLLQEEAHFVVTSEAIGRRLKELGAPPGRTHVCPVGIDIDEYPSPQEVEEHRRRERAGDLRVVTVGRLIPAKAPERLPELARRLIDGGTGVRWTVIGDGPLRRMVGREIERHRVGDRFTLAGLSPAEKVRSLLWESDLMVHNAVVAPDGGREGLGVVLMEAGAVGLPVVSCTVGGIPEVVVDGETGLLAPEGDLEGMADRISRLAGDDGLRVSLGLAAMKRVRSRFDSAALAAGLEDLYERIL